MIGPRYEKTCLRGRLADISFFMEQIWRYRKAKADCMYAKVRLRICCSDATKSGFHASRPIYDQLLIIEPRHKISYNVDFDKCRRR